MQMRDTREPRLLVPALGPFYAWASDVSWLLIRLTVGLILIPHGWPKLMAGAQAFATRSLARRGIEPSLPLAYLVIFLETLGGVMIAAGLFTRFFAAALAIHMLVIFFIHLPAGFMWTNRGYEYPLMWGLLAFAIALRGGGPYSVDRLLRREL